VEIVGKSNKFDFEVDEAGSPLALDNGVVHEIMEDKSYSFWQNTSDDHVRHIF
jgi:hypothetical protein